MLQLSYLQISILLSHTVRMKVVRKESMELVIQFEHAQLPCVATAGRGRSCYF